MPSSITPDMIKEANDGGAPLDLSVEYWSTGYMEMMVTFIFVLYILQVTGKHTGAPDLGVWGVPSICLVLWAMCQVDAFTYASLNPALAIGSFVMQVTFYPYNPQGVLTHYMW